MAATSSRVSAVVSNRDGGDGVQGSKKDGEAAGSVEDHLLPVLEKLSLSGPSPPSRKKKLLILDLNGILAHTFFPDEGVVIPSSRSPDAVMGRKYVFKRPFCHEFLRFCFENFDVAVWSSATRRNLLGAIRCVMGAFADRLLFIWDQADCTDTGFRTLEKKDKPLFVKELRKLWDRNIHSSELPQRHRGRFSPSNTLLIDDSPYKAILNPPNTAVFPLPYKVDSMDDASFGPNGELRSFLEGLAAADVDVPSYVGSHPLGQLPITASHRHWDFYSQVINRLHNHSVSVVGVPRSRRSTTVRLRENAIA